MLGGVSAGEFDHHRVEAIAFFALRVVGAVFENFQAAVGQAIN
jgi:hypothetical protein